MDIPFPRELQRQIENAIASHKYAAGDILTGHELAKRFDVPLEEIFQVLSVAHRKGLVIEQENQQFKVLGLVVPPRDSVFNHTAKLGFKPSSEVREVTIEPATAIVAQTLDLTEGAPVYRFVRTRYVNGEALANQTNHLSFEICPGLEQDDVSRHSFQKLLEEKYLTYTAEFRENFEIQPATEQDRQILNLPPNSSVWLVQRLAFSGTGYPVVWTNLRIHPDRWQYVSKLWPTAAAVFASRSNNV